MTPERWQQTEALLLAALQREPERRTAFLSEACAGDPALRREVESLLNAHSKARAFMETPALETAARMIAARQTREQPGNPLPSIGAIVSHYRILLELGHGGMGVVYKAQDLRLGRSVALKFLSNSIDIDATAFERLRQEARAASALNHPHICTIHDIDQYQGQPFIVMELLEGQTLAAKIDRRPLEVREILSIARQIGDALDASHQNEIVHGDIKPSNVMITRRGHVKLLDFGLAEIHPDASAPDIPATEKQLMGTLRYMSPERVLARPGDHRSDIFSLGVVLYEMATGRSPFFCSSDTETAKRILHGRADPVTGINPHIPQGLERIIGRCLEKKVESRFQNAREFLDSLRTVEETTGLRTSEPRPGNLPNPFTRFIGRQREIAEVHRLLERSRLVTLTGSGGVGKTRLALEAAGCLLEAHEDGVWFADLTSLSDEALVPQIVGSALGVREKRGRSIIDTLAAYLKPKRLLLVLDNCEHLVAACARLVDRLLPAAPDLRILATSRTVLGLEGETVCRVPSLELPNPDSPDVQGLCRSEAVQLFIDRIAAAKPDFTVTTQNAVALTQVCVQLEGIPLAIELAASRARVLSLEQIRVRLQDRFTLLTGGSRTRLPRHQTLAAAIDWSYNLLSEKEQIFFGRLSVFAGGWTLEAAETICSGDAERRDALEFLSALVDKSLVLTEEAEGQARYRLTATLQEYAQKQLPTVEFSIIQCRHAGFFLEFVEHADDKLKGSEPGEWLDRLTTENPNIRQALAWALQNDARIGLRIAAALERFWFLRGHFAEARKWLAAILEAEGSTQHIAERAKTLNAAGRIAWEQGDYPSGQSYCAEGLELFRKLDDRRGIASALNNLGVVAQRRGDYTEARSFFEESLQMYRELKDERGIAAALNNIGILATRQGDYAMARSCHEESLAIRRELGDRQGIAIALNNLGEVAGLQGDAATDYELRMESLAIRRELGDKHGIARLLNGLALLPQRQGNFAQARCLYDEALAISRELGDRQAIATVLHNLGEVYQLEGDYNRANLLYQESLSMCRELGDKEGIAAVLQKLGEAAHQLGDHATACTLHKQSLTILRDLAALPMIVESLENLAQASQARGQMERAVRVQAAAVALRESISGPGSTGECGNQAVILKAALDVLSADAFAVAWKQGHSMTTEEAIRFALDE